MHGKMIVGALAACLAAAPAALAQAPWPPGAGAPDTRAEDWLMRQLESPLAPLPPTWGHPPRTMGNPPPSDWRIGAETACRVVGVRRDGSPVLEPR